MIITLKSKTTRGIQRKYEIIYFILNKYIKRIYLEGDTEKKKHIIKLEI